MTPAFTTPTIGAVIPAFNGARYLAETIRSVLTQTVAVTELVVVDDGSVDDSAAVAAAFPDVRVIRQANAGQATAFNRGVTELTSDFVAFLDQDDLWTPDRLARQLPCFAEPTPPDLVIGHAQNFHSPDLPEEQRQQLYCPPEPLPGYSLGTLLLRRETFHHIGPFRTDWRIACHIEWFARASDMGLQLRLLPDVLLLRRLHGDNFSRREVSARPEFAHMLKFVLDRRRANKITPELL